KVLKEKMDEPLQSAQVELEGFTLDNIASCNYWKDVYELGKQPDLALTAYNDAVQENDLLTWIYTSGTTGKPKGVYLTRTNLVSNISACSHLLTPAFQKAITFLPLCHIFERMVVYMYISKGIKIYYSENLDTIVADINDVKPDIFTTVPRVLEKVYD